MGRRQARVRADELLDSFGLSAAAARLARTYSGGMRRRLDVAACGSATRKRRRRLGVPVIFLLAFTSSAFVPLQSIPGWLQAIGAHQPVNALVTAERALIYGGPAAHDALVSLAWSTGILLAFVALSARIYARMSQ